MRIAIALQHNGIRLGCDSIKLVNTPRMVDICAAILARCALPVIAS